MLPFESHNKRDTLPFEQPPQWAREAIWYQILVERFYNGNSENNPTRLTCENALIDPLPNDWTVTPWGHNWYKQEIWAKNTGLDFFRTIQMRRYGGDLDGVLKKISYLKELGITAIYFNPLNDAPSLHKYDVRHYHHIDVTFGDDPEGDMALMATEQHDDSLTWKWTSADMKFLKLLKILHSESIRVVLDFSWNHTGVNFWAFKDLVKNLDDSPYKDWYFSEIKYDRFHEKRILEYNGWMGISSLPELKKMGIQNRVPGRGYEGNLQEGVKKHIFDVARRWMDPFGNGDFSQGIDGMRLDVAEHIPLGFWREFRAFVRSINPDFYLVGECWWEEWPDKLMDPVPWVKGDIFDAVMHYQWYRAARAYFAKTNDKISLSDFRDILMDIYNKYPDYTLQAMMNTASTHDSPRVLTDFFNVNKYKFQSKPNEDPNYRTDKPGLFTYHRIKLFLLHQFTFVGAPHIYNGDEMGMTGADDPDNRKPMVWPDIIFEPATQSEFSKYEYEFTPEFDDRIFQYYKSLIALRKMNDTFVYGDFSFEGQSQNGQILAYSRKWNGNEYWVVINNNEVYDEIKLPFSKGEIVFNYNAEQVVPNTTILMPSFSGVVIKVI